MTEQQLPSPPPDTPQNTIGRLELAISTLLRAGILTSLTLVVAGTIVMFVRHPDYMRSPAALAHLKSHAYSFTASLPEMFRGVAAGQGRSIILLGVFVLFLTPVLRVLTSLIAFIFEKDWSFVIITSLVLIFLLASLLVGHAG